MGTVPLQLPHSISEAGSWSPRQCQVMEAKLPLECAPLWRLQVGCPAPTRYEIWVAQVCPLSPGEKLRLSH